MPSELCGTADGTGAVPRGWVRPPCPGRLLEASGGATATVSAALCNSSLPVSPLTMSHVQAFPPEPLAGLRCLRPGHPQAGAVTPSRQQSHPALCTALNAARRKRKQKAQLQATGRKEKKILPFFLPRSKSQIQVPFSTGTLKQRLNVPSLQSKATWLGTQAPRSPKITGGG